MFASAAGAGRMRISTGSVVVLVLCALRTALGYDGATCCRRALEDGVFIDPPPRQNQTCGQKYGPYQPAEPLYVDFLYCWENCAGIGRSKAREPSQWAAPVVQFILPSVIFSMGIPRRKKIDFNYLFDWPIGLFPWPLLNRAAQLGVSLLLFTVILVPVIIDTLIWIVAIIIMAGNMIVATLYEAHIDYRIVEYVLQAQRSSRPSEMLSLRDQKELLVAVVAGNLLVPRGLAAEETPQRAILDSLDGADGNAGQDKAQPRLLNLLGAQSSFGSAVGSPVLFYLGAFVYTILDLLNNPSSEDAAISLGFGIEWMIIVHVAICSGCALASNNPSTSAGIVGAEHEALLPRPRPPRRASTLPGQPAHGIAPDQPPGTWRWFTRTVLGWSDVYETAFQPVTIWSRGTNKVECLRRTATWEQRPDFERFMEVTAWGWLLKVLAPALVLVALPPATGGVVAYFTPPRGIACRSLSFIIYAACQGVVTFLAVLRNAGWAPVLGGTFGAASALFWFGSLLAAVGGTTMQFVGVYRNCICYAPSTAWRALWALNPPVNVASDTADSRHASRYWVWMSGTAAVFMAVNCYVGWWYQRLVRKRFTQAVAAMEEPQGGAEAAGADEAEDPSTPLIPWAAGVGTWAVQAEQAIDAVQSDDLAMEPLRRRTTFPNPVGLGPL